MEDRSFPTRNSMALDNALGLLKKKKKTRDRDGKGSPEDSCAGLALLVKEVEPNYSLVSHNRVWKSPCDSPGESRERPSQGPNKHHRHPDKGPVQKHQSSTRAPPTVRTAGDSSPPLGDSFTAIRNHWTPGTEE